MKRAAKDSLRLGYFCRPSPTLQCRQYMTAQTNQGGNGVTGQAKDHWTIHHPPHSHRFSGSLRHTVKDKPGSKLRQHRRHEITATP